VVSISKRILFCAGLLLLVTNLSAQWSISGKVIDAASGEGLSYVNITFRDGILLNTTSDHDGAFYIHGLTDPFYEVMFSMIGFQSVQFDSITASSDPLIIRMQPESYLTKEVVVSASRKSQSINLAPASVGLVTRMQIEQAGTSSFDDAFNGINGITVTRSSNSNVQSFSIRGASEVAGGGIGNRVLLLLDGRPAITPESGGALWNLVPLGAIDRVEVIKGAYSSLYGSSAMGGIVNVITRTPDTTSHSNLHLHYGAYGPAPAYTGYERYNDFYGADFITSRKLGKWSYLFNFAGKSNDGNREQTSFNQYNGYGKFKFDFSPNRSLQVSAMYNDIFNDTPGTWLSTTQAYSVADYRKDDTQHRREWNGDLYYQALAGSNVKYSTRFYYYGAASDYVFNGDPDNDSTNVNTGKQYVDSEYVNVHRFGNTSQVDVSVGDVHYLIGGFDLQADYIDGQPDTVLYGIHRATNIGVFVQDQMTFSERLIVTAGLRYDYYNIKGTFMEGNVNPKIAAVYQVNEKVSVRSLLAKAFRNPSISERYTKFEQGGGLRFTTSPLLRAEKLTLSAEVGTKINLNPFRFDVAVYYNKYKDLIYYEQRPTPDGSLLFEVVNLNKAIMQGFEISAEYSPLKQLAFQAGYSYLDAKDVSDEAINDVLAYKSKHQTYFNILASHKRWQFFFQSRSRSRIDEVFIYPGSEPDGYILFNGKLSYTISEKVSTYFKIDNIGDVQYEEIERYRMPGRNFMVGVNLQF
jgi:outer membrane receptor protein involved in Fe transport